MLLDCFCLGLDTAPKLTVFAPEKGPEWIKGKTCELNHQIYSVQALTGFLVFLFSPCCLGQANRG